MRRREFITLLGGAAAAWPHAARAQAPNPMRRVGVLLGYLESEPEGQRQVAAFRDGLAALGWIPGRNVEVAYRWHGGNTGRAQAFANELLALRPDVLVANSTPSLIALQQASHTIPIIFMVADPVGQGLVTSLARPGGNMTGFGLEEPTLGAKWIELLKEIAPGVVHAAIIFNPQTAPYARMFLPSMEAAGRSAGLTLNVSPVGNGPDVERVIATTAREQGGGLVVLPDSFTIGHREMIVAATAKQRVPAIYALRSWAAAGGLIAYGIERAELFRAVASYVDRILKGEKPGDLPVQLPTKFELAINLKTAKALGLEVPWFLEQRADEVIE
jgi:putative tryptophan/tyrosine transport system substrate-binding protein